MRPVVQIGIGTPVVMVDAHGFLLSAIFGGWKRVKAQLADLGKGFVQKLRGLLLGRRAVGHALPRQEGPDAVLNVHALKAITSSRSR